MGIYCIAMVDGGDVACLLLVACLWLVPWVADAFLSLSIIFFLFCSMSFKKKTRVVSY